MLSNEKRPARKLCIEVERSFLKIFDVIEFIVKELLLISQLSNAKKRRTVPVERNE